MELIEKSCGSAELTRGEEKKVAELVRALLSIELENAPKTRRYLISWTVHRLSKGEKLEGSTTIQ